MRFFRGRRSQAIAAVAGSAALLITGLASIPALAANPDPNEGLDYTSNIDELSQANIDATTAKIEAMAAEINIPSEDAVAVTPFATVGAITGPYHSSMIGDGTTVTAWFKWWENGDGIYPDHTLGAFVINGVKQWCRDFSTGFPVGAGTITSSSGPVAAAQNIMRNGGYSSLVLDSGAKGDSQMGYIIRSASQINGGAIDSDDNETFHHIAAAYAAVSIIIHSNYEETAAGQAILTSLPLTLNANSGWGPDILRLAEAYVADAKANAADFWTDNATVEVAPDYQTFTLKNVGIKQTKGGSNWVAGVDLTVGLQGPGVFETVPAGGTLNADKTVWTGKTANGPLTFTGRSTGNGKVSANYTFGKVQTDGVGSLNRPGTQNTVAYQPQGMDPVVSPPTTMALIYNFQPMLISGVNDGEMDYKVIEPGATTIGDHLSVFADPTFKDVNTDKVQDQWLGEGRTFPTQDSYKALPVTFTGTAYKLSGELPTGELADVDGKSGVPSDAVAVANAEFTTTDRDDCSHVATDPCDYDVEVDLNDNWDNKPGFVVWVWEMDVDNQPHVVADELSLIAANWHDTFGIAEEQLVLQWEGKIESNIKIHPTNDNTYLVDDLWITKLPSNYPTFEGGYGFGADTKTISQTLYFWEGMSKDQVTSLDGAVEVGSIDVPAKNGFYPSLGDPEFKLQRDDEGNLKVGTYQFVHELVANENPRVPSFHSIVPDEHEMYEVTGQPQIGTTATGKIHNVVQAEPDTKVIDTVSYLGLVPGKTYDMKGLLLDVDTLKPILVDGKEVTATATFTPETAEGTIDVEFVFDATGMDGKTFVVYEYLYLDDEEVASHEDPEDEAQTIYVPKLGTQATGPDGGKVIEAKVTTIDDKVCWENAPVREGYSMMGVLMDKSTHKKLVIDGKEHIVSAPVDITSSEGCTTMTFDLDASKLNGREIVVFEYLYLDDVEIASHEDITDKGQTVQVKDGGQLAKTGAAGIVLLVVAGGVLASGGWFLRRRSTALDS